MEKALEYFQREKDEENQYNDGVCLERLSQARQLMDLIDENIEFVKHRPSNFYSERSNNRTPREGSSKEAL
jgi:hypothetical protein